MKKTTLPSATRIVCCYYISNKFGSEYRSGYEFLALARSSGFTTAIIADLENNCCKAELESTYPGLEIIVVPSIIKKQSLLYKYNDVIPQFLWHKASARQITLIYGNCNTVWIQNGALPWLPITPYLDLCKNLIWGPVGGGQAAPKKMRSQMSYIQRMRESVRNRIEVFYLSKTNRILEKATTRPLVQIMARTREAKILLTRTLSKTYIKNIPIIPEIVAPLRAMTITKPTRTSPKFVWVGQDIPRKNLPLALEIFDILRHRYFPDATLDIFGLMQGDRVNCKGVTYHGWVEKIVWENYLGDGVLLQTSYREGLPSVILEALSAGLLCVATDSGSLSTLSAPTLLLLSGKKYPSYDRSDHTEIVTSVRDYLKTTTVNIPSVDFSREILTEIEMA